jgi:hypothetical protein
MRAILALIAVLAAASPASAANMQQCQAKEYLANQLSMLRQEGKSADEAMEIIAKRIMAQNPPPLGLGRYIQPIAIAVYLLPEGASPIIADCYREASGRPETHAAVVTSVQRGAIGDHVRECWRTDQTMLDLEKMQILLTVTTDPAGVARAALVAPEDQGRVVGDMQLRIFAERAVRAVLDPRCANLPLPISMLGTTNTVTFRFRP